MEEEKISYKAIGNSTLSCEDFNYSLKLGYSDAKKELQNCK